VTTAPPSAPERPNRLPLVFAAATTGLVFAVVLLAPLVLQPAPPPDLSEVTTWEVLDRQHTEGDVSYETVPPAGGPHAGLWIDCGEYDVPLREENAVHDLEHGTLWITYLPDLGASSVARLRRHLPDNGLLSPQPGQPAPVVVTVWGAQLHLDGADDPRLELFIDAYGDGHTAPEPNTSCHGGTDDPTGGTGATA
jgi:hypothetical protein